MRYPWKVAPETMVISVFSGDRESKERNHFSLFCIFLAKCVYYLFNTVSFKQHKSIDKIEIKFCNQIKINRKQIKQIGRKKKGKKTSSREISSAVKAKAPEWKRKGQKCSVQLPQQHE